MKVQQLSHLEDQALTVDILHDVRFFPPPSQPLPPAYHTTHFKSEEDTYDVKLTGGVIGTRHTLSSPAHGRVSYSDEEPPFAMHRPEAVEGDLGGDLQSLLWVAGHKHTSQGKEKVTNATMFM